MHHRNEMKKRRFHIFAFIVAAVLFVLLSVRGTKKQEQISEAIFLPFSSALDPASISRQNPSPSLISFLGDGYLGYIDSANNQLYAAQFSDRAAIDSSGWISYDRLATALQAFSLGSKPSTIAGYGYPWFKSSRRFLIRADQMGIAEMHADGSIVWEREFPMPITAIDATPTTLGIGFLDGSIRFLGKKAENLYSEPHDSQQDSQHIRTVYGIALSGDGRSAAVLRGMSPQKIESYRRAGTGFVKSSERELPSGAPLQATMCYAEDGSHVVIAQGEQLIYYNTKKNYVRKLANGAALGNVASGAFVQHFVLGPTGGNTIAVLQVQSQNPPTTKVLILKHGIIEREEPGAVSASAGKGALIIVFRDGVEIVKGWQQ